MREDKLRQIISEEIGKIQQPELVEVLTSAEVAKILDVKITTLAQWRSEGRGPDYTKPGGKGKPLYPVTCLNNFICSGIIRN